MSGDLALVGFAFIDGVHHPLLVHVHIDEDMF